MASHRRINHRHTGNVEQHDLGSGRDDALQERLGHVLSPCCVNGPDDWQRQNPLPDLDNGGLQLADRRPLLGDGVLEGGLPDGFTPRGTHGLPSPATTSPLGSTTRKVLPSPGTLWTSTRPPWAWTRSCTSESPSPRPCASTSRASRAR